MMVPWWELILRAVVVYCFLLIMLRITGKRQVGQLSPFDLVLLLVLSNAVQNSMNGGDNSLVGGLISACALMTLNLGVGFLAFRNKRMERWLDGAPMVLIHNGRVFPKALAHALLTQQALDEALREAGCASLAQVHMAVLENNGTITVIPRKS
jgi:uncharacterized membrane protein YcaP (DUF421 family)